MHFMLKNLLICDAIELQIVVFYEKFYVYNELFKIVILSLDEKYRFMDLRERCKIKQ